MSPRTPRFSLRPLALAVPLALAGGLGLLPATVAQAEQRQPLSYDIPAGPLTSQLNRFAAQSGIYLAGDGSLTAGKTSQALRGEYTVADGLNALLAGTGLAAVQGEDGSWSLYPMAEQSGALELSGLSISGKAPGSITEGTGSYGTGSTSSSTRLNLAPRETPQSITVVTRQRIEDQKLDNLPDALDATTGVIVKPFSMGADAPQVWARGSTINNFQIDGVPTSSSLANYLQSTIAYDRIEVVRGATGMMNGVGSPSATINMIRKRPTFDPQASVSVEAGTWDRYGTGIDISGSLTESGNVRGRLAADYKTQHAWTDNYEQENTALYGIGEIDLTENTLLSLGFNHIKRYTDSATRLFPIVDINGRRISTDPSDNDSPDWSYYDHTLSSAFASVEHRFDGGWSLKSELTYSKYHYDAFVSAFMGNVDLSTGTGGRVQSSHWGGTADQHSLDTYITGPFSLLGREHELITGVTLATLEATNPSYTQTTPTHYIPNFWDWSKTSPVPAFRRTGETELHEYQYSAYLSSRFSLTDDTRLILGSRVTDWKQNRDTHNTVTDAKEKTRSRESGVFVPYVGVTHDLDDTWTLYASYTKIFNPQPYYIRDINDQALPPEEGTSYEAGIKAGFNEGRLNASLALFKTEQDSLAVWDGATRSYSLENGTDTEGVELEFNGELAEGWNLSSGYVYSVTRNAEDQRIVTRAPRHSLKTFTTYRLPGALDKLTVGGGFNWESKTGDNLKVYTQESYALFSLMGRYDINQNLSITANVNNLFNKEYYVATNGYWGVHGAPRNVMTSLKYSF
ncbi:MULTISPECIES: TonB-dependent siderophore receptor [unclassified Pseudomonas]|uniref:TonB-dependent siderophore receptor n=1 Tax=unclassified Pseudomonas TaxID=196821 RepID=UPI002448E9B1|nr:MULTISPECIES: TonB-dependent siderophore receptor [unclassified Pseudomonas]MDG9926964.1 TonB-dependent siderophore receptor [Pseudomonas sp. GD04042]MDH0484607.1 TonB-dependent siderophore receptor [Pseudomonas sp. GD04015]MDH0602379.1 TonB-dependent siderophore receptor [Pseudomonas sp. GD03869]